MKKNQAASLVIAILLLTLCFTSCHKTRSNTTGTFYFHIHSYVSGREIADTATLYADSTGRHFSLSKAQFYISNISLHNVNGTKYSFQDVYILKTLDSEQYLIGQAPVGTYDYITFNVGLDAAANTMTPANRQPSSPLSATDMWYGNSSEGYIFMNLEGKADTTAAQTGAGLVPFSYQIGGGGNLKTVTMPARTGGSQAGYQPYILTAGSAQFVHLSCDFSRLLSTVDFKTQDSTNSYNINPVLAQTIANNIPKLFQYEE